MSEIYGLGIAMPMNYKAMIEQLKRFGNRWEPVEVTIAAPQIGFEVNLKGNGKLNVSGNVESDTASSLSTEETDAALMWAATALLGTLSTRGLSVVGMPEIEAGSHVEYKRKVLL